MGDPSRIPPPSLPRSCLPTTTSILSRVATIGVLLPGLGCHSGPPSHDHLLGAGSALISDTGTPAKGGIEVEVFGTIEKGELVETPLTLRYGITERVEAFATTLPFVHTVREGPDGRGFGDLTLGGTYRFSGYAERGSSAAVQAGFVVPTGDEDEGLGSGQDEVFALLVGSHWMGDWMIAATGSVSALGEDLGSDADVAWAGSLDTFWAMHERFSLLGQLGGSTIPERDQQSTFLTLGAVYAIRHNWLVAAGVTLGLDDTSPDALFLVGLTFASGD